MKVAEKRRRRGSGALGTQTVPLIFCLAGLLAGCLLGAVLGILGLVLIHGANVKTWEYVLLACLLAFAAGELTRRSVKWFPPQRYRETPRSWVDWLPESWAAGTGFLLGSGVATRIGFAVWYVIPCSILLSGSIATGVLAGGLYGLVRVALSLGLFGTSSSGRRICLLPECQTAGWT